MTVTPQEIHEVHLEQNFLDRGTATAVCSCGTEHPVTAPNFTGLWAAAYDWHADHKRTLETR